MRATGARSAWWYRDGVVTFGADPSARHPVAAPFAPGSGPNAPGRSDTQLDPAHPEADDYEQLAVGGEWLDQIDASSVGGLPVSAPVTSPSFAYDVGGLHPGRLWTNVDPSTGRIEWVQYPAAHTSPPVQRAPGWSA
ncbi:MAG: hypothetical protein R2698_13245 [Microthrixaceae bacterium]